MVQPPTFGAILNATTSQAEEDNRKQEESDTNHTILSHNSPYLSDNDQPTTPTPATPTFNPAPASQPAPLVPPMISQTPEPTFPAPQPAAPTFSQTQPEPPATPTQDLAALQQAAFSQAEPASNANIAISSQREQAVPNQVENPVNPFATPPVEPTTPNFGGYPDLPPPPPVPDFSNLENDAAPLPPPVPNFDVQPPAQTPSVAPDFGASQPVNPMFPVTPPEETDPNDPTQFKIPG